MDESPTKTTVSSSTNRIWKIAAVLFLSTTVIFVSLFVWSEYKEDTNSQGFMGTSCGNFSCNNGGTCFLDDFQPKCACRNGFTGDNCTITPCSRTPCEHGGNCSVIGSSFFCTCLNGFTGLQCQSTPCVNYSCDNGGTCFIDEFQPKCACKNGFTGENCTEIRRCGTIAYCTNIHQYRVLYACVCNDVTDFIERYLGIIVTPCSKSPCEHGGNCSVTGSSFSCNCLNGFTGLQCQSTPCVNYSCDNGGTCFIDEFQPKCACKNGFTGENCTVTPCSKSPCEYGGNCSVTGSSFSCTCLNGFTGLQCQSTPCFNYTCDNDGTCFLDGFQPKCACKNGFTGEKCTITPCSRSPCEHGGICSVTGSSFSCTCVNGFTGLQCQIYQADFENNMESIFIQDLNDDFNWTLRANSTPSSGTGPSSAYKGSYYLFMETSTGNEGDVARLLSRDFVFEYPGCLKFHHHMYGSDMGTLNVYQGSSLVWNKTGDQGDQWQLAEISLQANSFSSSKILFEAVRGTGFKSDMAIDDVLVLLTGC